MSNENKFGKNSEGKIILRINRIGTLKTTIDIIVIKMTLFDKLFY